MKRKVLIRLVALLMGTAVWVACETGRQGAAPQSVPAVAPAGGVVNPTPGRESPSADSVVPGSPAHRKELVESARLDFARRVERYRAEGKSEEYIAFMRENALEGYLREVRTRPAEWFTIESILERARAQHERDIPLFLEAGIPREKVDALLVAHPDSGAGSPVR